MHMRRTLRRHYHDFLLKSDLPRIRCAFHISPCERKEPAIGCIRVTPE